jgi:hypothetical protein
MPAAQRVELAPVQGEPAKDDRPPERQPGTAEHLGSDQPYAGGAEEAQAAPAAASAKATSKSASSGS